MAEYVRHGRRAFLGTAAMTVAAAQFGVLPTGGATGEAKRQLAALGDGAVWLNSPRLTAAALAGKVVVVDFCTYSCINWLRTLPYIRAWAEKYRRGVTLIGVHTPEFDFERDPDHVRRALKQMRIEYPIVIDNEYAIWRAFDNNYWPALYFIDRGGRLRHHHFGEGEYESSERTIQRLLGEAGTTPEQGFVSPQGAGVEAAADWRNLKSPERYLGYARTEKFASPAVSDRRQVYAVPKRLTLNQWALAGEWTIGRQATVLARANGRLVCRFHARDLHLVMGPPRQGGPVRFRISLDGNPPGAAHGGDVDEGGNGTVTEPRLYQLLRQPAPIVERQCDIEFFAPGVETYAFTFG